ncbi:MAG: ATPase, T2SS/T4P/T4SS family [Lachnospiraceae bacterium]|nr:ATPase, T2SS/T4P/T4SS family [Lachnospiraceae bacterium]
MKEAEELRQELLQRLDTTRDVPDSEIQEMIDSLILSRGRTLHMTVVQKAWLRRELFYSVRKLDVLQDLIEDGEVTEIMVNGSRDIFVEKGGGITKYDRSFTSREKLEDVIQQIVGSCNRVVNEQQPIVDARLENGSRVNVVLAPVALNGPILTIRRFPDEPITMERLIDWESITREAAGFLRDMVQAGYSILVGGGTGSGKTTFLNALSNYIPQGERVITIEDDAELQIQGVKNLVRLESRGANMEGNKEITLRDLIKSALRMRPTRLVVGELRDGAAVDYLSSLNIGTEGSMSTAHANSTREMISRLEMMVLMGNLALPLPAIRRQIASGLDILVHLGRNPDGKRQVLEISEVLGMQGEEVALQTLYVREGKEFRKKNNLKNCEKLQRAGISIPKEA